MVGADTALGAATIDALVPRPGEVRAFVTSPQAAAELRARSVKVALGDVSDGSHVGGAALNAFCAVFMLEAAADERERSFADNPAAVLAAWVEGVNDAGVSRVIVVGSPDQGVLDGLEAEYAIVDPIGREPGEVASTVARLEDVAVLSDSSG